MKDVNDKKQLQEQEEVQKLFAAQMETLRKTPGFDNYLKEIRGLGKAILNKLVTVKPLTDEMAKMLLYYQAQLDLLFSIYNISREELINEINEEQFD